MLAVNIDTFTDYVDYLEVHQDEFLNLFNTILINVTGFFRDAPAWDYLEREIVPRIIAERKEEPIRIWCAGCASGEEAYSIAMVFAEAMGPGDFRDRVKIYATDVDEEELSTARQAIYTTRVAQAVPEPLRERYFERQGDRYAFRKDFRRCVIFGRHDLLSDAPISRIDLLISRNTLMYFNADAQARILARYFYALREGGYLFLGKAETLLAHANIFAPVELKFRIFVKPVSDPELRDRVFPAIIRNGNGNGTEETHLRELAFQSDPIAQLAVDGNMTLVLANEKARTLFGINARELGRPLQDLDVSYRPVELRSLINQAIADQRPVAVHEVYFPVGSTPRWFDVELMPLSGPRGDVLGVKVAFIEVTRARELAEELQQSKSDLETAYEELQSSNEELETTNEELQSTVEELETTNEELQSTNEELETMNEELQSTNEELEAVNDELRERGDQLNGANAFLESILTSLRDGVAVVDSELRVQAWNSRAEDLWGVRADEVRGTHLANLDIGLHIETLLQPIRDCLAGRLTDYERVVEATNRRGRHILCRVSMSPMDTRGAGVTGAVILMEEVENGENGGGSSG
jgi:two-component system CheB/CheR fusion protein